MGLVKFVVTGSNVKSVLVRAKDVLCRVDEHVASSPSDDDWRGILPDWFLERCAPEPSYWETEARNARLRMLSPEEQAYVAATEPWPLLNWLYWLDPEERAWFWWDSVVVDERHAMVSLEVPGWPFPWGAFSWLLRAAGADKVREEGE